MLHLLYARFWHKVLYDIGVVTRKEPFQSLVSQGMILGEVRPCVALPLRDNSPWLFSFFLAIYGLETCEVPVRVAVLLCN